MKAKILKIAGVKSEKEFYSKYPTEEAFMKEHGKAFKKAQMGTQLAAQQWGLQGLPTSPKPQFTQTVNFGKPTLGYVPKGLPDSRFANNVSPTVYDITGMDKYYQKELPSYQSPTDTTSAVTPVNAKELFGQNLGLLGKTGVVKTIQNIQKIQGAVDERRKAKQLLKVSEVAKDAAATRPERQKPRYVRPDDSLLQPDQMGMMPYGTGYDVLGMAENGMQIGGNLTEIQNMYNPGTLYDHLGYEPLDESSKVKQFKKGGKFKKAQGGADMGLIQAAMDIGSDLASIQGDIAANIIGRKTKKWTNTAMQNLQQGAQAQAMQTQFSPFMKDGGSIDDEYKWVSHSWQPQVITKFGEYSTKDLLKPDPMMDTLRTGGNIRDNYMNNDENIRMNMAMGGSLKTHWGGDAEVVSYNPHSAGSGETVMLNGNSHEESDGQGNTGIGMSYGGNMVEAERGEPVSEMEEGGSINDTSAVVFGNMMIPSYVVSELEDENAKGKKFKTYSAHLAKQEAKQNKIAEKATSLISNIEGDNPYDMLKMNAGMAMLKGADMSLKNIADKKRTLAGGQSAILDTAEQMGVDSDALAKGKIKQAKKNGVAQSGVLLSSKNQPVDYTSRWNNFIVPKISIPAMPLTDAQLDAESAAFYAENPQPEIILPKTPSGIGPTDPTLFRENLGELPTADELWPKKKGLFGKAKDFLSKNQDTVKSAYNELRPFLIPSNQMSLQPEQLMGEMYALSQNVLQPVRAQTFQPLLETRAPQMTAQEQLNKNQADFNSAQRMIGNNPAALSMLAAQKQAADRQAIAQTQAANIQQQMAAANRNIALLNDATIRNLATLDAQYVRQETAESTTKAQAQAALNSIASKIGQNKLENLQNAVMQNMYNFRFTPKGRVYNVNPIADFNLPQITALSPETKEAIKKQAPELAKYLKLDEKKGKAKNGSLVKAIKNL